MDYDLNLEDDQLEKQQTKEILETELTKASTSLYLKLSLTCIFLSLLIAHVNVQNAKLYSSTILFHLCKYTPK